MTNQMTDQWVSQDLGSSDPLLPRQWYDKDTYYQILVVEPSEQRVKNISKKILAKKRGSEKKEKSEESFDGFELDDCTIKKLESYPRNGDKDKVSAYLPSPGVVLIDDFMDQLFSKKEEEEEEYDKHEQIELGNFYATFRTLLHSRKISQLIAKSWWCYLKAQENKGELWEEFTSGNWDEIDTYTLDGLITREIFLYAGAHPPNYIEPEDVYLPLKPKEKTKQEKEEDKTRFVILPTSRAWQGISLSLLLAGQAYYKIGEKYHQISQPILSTGEITSKYSVEVDWNRFDGDIKDLIISQEKPWIAYQVVLPYPSIPSEVNRADLRKWADAEDDDGSLPFYRKSKDDKEKYLMDVDYFNSPYPYIPLSCS